ncbi:MAG: hypothetical protein Q9168_006286 [Polycauliona sp. 1 TL-2023]
MVNLSAEAIVDIVFGAINVMLTMAIIWQTRSIRKERCRKLSSMNYPSMRREADVETGNSLPSTQRSGTLSDVKARPEEKLFRSSTL